MGIVIRKKKLKNKELSLYLDIIHNRVRTFEFLGLRLKPESFKNREYNKDVLEIAERIKIQRWNEILNEIHGVDTMRNKKINFFAFAKAEIEGFTVAKRGYEGVIKMLKDFVGSDVLYTTSINEKFINRFYDYMETKLTGETPSTYYKKLKRLLTDATKQKLFRENPSNGIRCRKFVSKEKAVLNFDEIKLLMNAHCPNAEVKDAFIFCCLSGIRFSDMKDLKRSNIKGNRLELVQKKTKVKIEGILNEDALKIVAKRIAKDGFLFSVPSHTSCLKNLKSWMKNAEIEKKITWHCSRHGYATNLIAHGADIHTTSKLLGHSSLTYTQRYVRESNKLKEAAVNNLPKLF